MINWEKESLDLLNQGHFRITDPGPLHSPIQRFSIRRDDKLDLILETEAAAGAKSGAVPYPPGTVRFDEEQAELVSVAGIKAVLAGVATHSVKILHGGSGPSELKETASVRQLTVTPGDPAKAAYTIEWLENLPASPFIWPDSIQTVMETTTTHGIALFNDGLTILDSSHRQSSSQAAAKLLVSGHTLYICALGRTNPDVGIKPGCVVYVGTPDDLTRKKLRTALSFALGVYLIELGHTVYDQEWRIISAISRSAYSLDKKAFDLIPMPLAPLGNRFQYELDRVKLTRMVNALVAAYDTLDLGNLSWAYWHACGATVHIAPAHFGAAIEALQRKYIEGHPSAIATRILPPDQWQELRSAVGCAVAEADISDDSKRALSDKLGSFNQVPQRAILKSILQAIGIELGPDEDDAWRRRDRSAHGLPIPEGDELAAIRDMKLLRGLFHRMLLRMSNAADAYVDYASPNHPYRRVQEPVPRH
jgi:hypothetical protein